MLRAFFVLSIICVVASACTQRMICPAYQSAFIYDKNELRKKFSIFGEDSTPKVFTASKNKYLIAEPTSYRKKLRSLQTIEKKDVYTHLPDSLDPNFKEDGEDGVIPGAELDLAARSVIDSIYIEDVAQDTSATAAEDSVYMISVDKEVRYLHYDAPDSLIFNPDSGKYVPKIPKYVIREITFNVEQDMYMWYLRDYLILPDVKMAKEGQAQQAKAAKKQKKGFFGFFKNIFKKKKKNETDSTTLQTQAAPKEDDFDYVDEDEQQKDPQTQGAEPPARKGLFGRKKKSEPEPSDSVLPADEEKPARKKKEKKSKKKKGDQPADQPAEEDTKKDDSDGF
jgi:hypothetical protein